MDSLFWSLLTLAALMMAQIGELRMVRKRQLVYCEGIRCTRQCVREQGEWATGYCKGSRCFCTSDREWIRNLSRRSAKDILQD
ncbi:hypothetical protein MTO96_021876 [Rhipicephalus appendiculatus]